MLTALLILVVSIGLFGYWFRYVCLLIVHTRRSEVDGSDISSRIRLNYLEVAEQLEDGQAGYGLNRLESLLDSDYRLLRDILTRVSLENRLLICHYHVLRLWYRLTHWIAPTQARVTLMEITGIVRFLAVSVSEESVS